MTMSTARGARSRTCSSEVHKSASTTIASGSSVDTASISASSVCATETTSNPFAPSSASMLPMRPAVITLSRSLCSTDSAAEASGEAERSSIDMAPRAPMDGRRRLPPPHLGYHRGRPRSCRTIGLRAGTTRHHPSVAHSDYRRTLRDQIVVRSEASRTVPAPAALGLHSRRPYAEGPSPRRPLPLRAEGTPGRVDSPLILPCGRFIQAENVPGHIREALASRLPVSAKLATSRPESIDPCGHPPFLPRWATDELDQERSGCRPPRRG